MQEFFVVRGFHSFLEGEKFQLLSSLHFNDVGWCFIVNIIKDSLNPRNSAAREQTSSFMALGFQTHISHVSYNINQAFIYKNIHGSPVLHLASRSTSRVRIPASAAKAMSLFTHTFFLDSFAQRQWDDPNYGGTRVSYDKAAFVQRIQDELDNGAPLADGYAPFCKHIFVPNFVGAKLGALAITEVNRVKLQSGYTKRRPEELAVLTRWFSSSDVEVPEAKYLDIILYSREQLVNEYAAMPTKGASGDLPDAPWGIISIKAQDEPYETPMQPITMLRNALGREEGGSGVPLDREAYEKSIAYWETHATIVDGPRPNGE